VVNGSLQSAQRQTRLSSWPVLEVELAVAPVEGAGVVPLDAGFEDPEDGADGAGAALLALSGAGAAACVGDIPDMVRARDHVVGWCCRCCEVREEITWCGFVVVCWLIAGLWSGDRSLGWRVAFESTSGQARQALEVPHFCPRPPRVDDCSR